MLLSGALAALPLFATTVRAQGDTTAVKRWKGAAEFSFTDQSGTRSLRLLTGGFGISHLIKDEFELSLSLETRYGESQDEVIARRHQGSFSVDLQPLDTWSPFFFVDAERDRLQRLDLRASGGAGIKFTPYRAKRDGGDASVSLALLNSYQNLSATPDEPRPGDSHTARWSLRVRGRRELSTGVSLQHTSFVQPVWNEVSDYLFRSDSGVKVLLMDNLALSVVYQLNRNSTPPEGVEADERILKTGIILDF